MWKKSSKGSAKIYTHPDASGTIIVNFKGVCLNGVYYASLKEAKEHALKESIDNRTKAAEARIAALEGALREAQEAVATQNGVVLSACKKTAALRTEMERIADLTERWTDSLVSQVNQIAREALAAIAAPGGGDTSDGWVIRKNGYFYRPNAHGYTSSIYEAGRFAESDLRSYVEEAAGVTAHRASEFLPPPAKGGDHG